MELTERDLMVARAVWDAFIRRMYAFPHSAPSCDVDVAALLESLPEPAEYYRAAKCPVCDGTGLVSRPPGVAGDQPTWSSLSSGPFPCRSCGSTGVLHLSEPAGVKGPDKLGGNSEPAEHERHCSLCEGQYIHDECDGLGLGPPDHAEHEQAAQDAVIDCGDNSCIFKPPGVGGMRTNGGCHCYERAGFGPSAVGAARQMLPEVLRLRREIAAARAEGERAERERLSRAQDADLQVKQFEEFLERSADDHKYLIAAARAEGARAERERWQSRIEDYLDCCNAAEFTAEIAKWIDGPPWAAQDEHGGEGE